MCATGAAVLIAGRLFAGWVLQLAVARAQPQAAISGLQTWVLVMLPAAGGAQHLVCKNTTAAG